MFEESVEYSDINVEETIESIEGFKADFGGTDIASPLLDIMGVEKEQNNFKRHVILLTDGQVGNTYSVINLISTMK